MKVVGPTVSIISNTLKIVGGELVVSVIFVSSMYFCVSEVKLEYF